ncbi:MAG: hypothetical protein AB8B87_25585 [Granulosicoccus sp.]
MSDCLKHAVSVFLPVLILSGCGNSNDASSSGLLSENESPVVAGNDGPEGDSALHVNNTRYPLDSALGDIWGQRGEHFLIEYTLTDGNFSLETVVLDGQSHQVLVPALATAILHVDVYSAGRSFEYESYGFVPAGGGVNVAAGVGYFSNAYVGVDTDDDGRVSDQEQIDVIEGTVNFLGSPPDISLNFSMTLINGQQVTGDYTGLFDFTAR